MTLTKKQTFEKLEDIIDLLLEVGNGTTNEQLHKAADSLIEIRNQFYEENAADISWLSNYEAGEPLSLSKDEALWVKKFKEHSTYRALSKKFLGYECQYSGKDLAVDAACRLLDVSREKLFSHEFGKNQDFDKEHEHKVFPGGYWWE